MDYYRDCIESTISDEGSENYATKERSGIKLDLTVNPLQLETGMDELLGDIEYEDLRPYPKPPALPELKEGLAQIDGVDPDNIMLTAGADQAIEIVLTHVLDPGDPVAIPVPTFVRYELVAEHLCDADTIFTDTPEQALETDADLVCLVTPNNPSTRELDKDAVTDLLEDNPDTLFLIDAVFTAYGSWNPAELVTDHENLIVLRSLSKEIMAGLRLGHIVAQPDHLRGLRKGVSPFRVPTAIQKIGLEILEEREEFLEQTREFFNTEYEYITDHLDETRRETDLPFYLVRTERPSGTVRQDLIEEGVSVVDAGGFRGMEEHWLRIAIGHREDNETLIKALKTVGR